MTDDSPPALIPGAQLVPLTGDEHLSVNGTPLVHGSILEFWQWVAADLRGNALRGHFAEWLVGLLLGIRMTTRTEWDSQDHIHGPIRIEVKSSAYIQGWGQRKTSDITFGALVKQAWDNVSGAYGATQQLNADWYVFALETCAHGPDYNPLDLSQWVFHVVDRDRLGDLKPKQRLSLARVAALGQRMTAEEFHRDGRRVMELDGRGVVLVDDAGVAAAPG